MLLSRSAIIIILNRHTLVVYICINCILYECLLFVNLNSKWWFSLLFLLTGLDDLIITKNVSYVCILFTYSRDHPAFCF